jgi:hypothetical protein
VGKGGPAAVIGARLGIAFAQAVSRLKRPTAWAKVELAADQKFETPRPPLPQYGSFKNPDGE